MTNVIFSITKENGTLMARLDEQITSNDELDDLIDKLYESLRFLLELRCSAPDSMTISIRREDLSD